MICMMGFESLDISQLKRILLPQKIIQYVLNLHPQAWRGPSSPLFSNGSIFFQCFSPTFIPGYHRNIPSSGMRISNGVDDFIACLRRRARRYRAQAAKQGGHFAAVILEGGRSELRLFGGAIRPGVKKLDFLCNWVRLFLIEVYSLMVVK